MSMVTILTTVTATVAAVATVRAVRQRWRRFQHDLESRARKAASGGEGEVLDFDLNPETGVFEDKSLKNH